MSSINFSALLLAGGRSSRMGVDKAAIQLGAQPLWERQLQTLQLTGADEILISGSPAGAYAQSGHRIIADQQPGLGPLGGIVSAFRQTSYDYLLVLAIDLPQMPPEFLRCLAQTACAQRIGIVPRSNLWFEPLGALYSRASLALMERHLAMSDRSLQFLVREAIRQGSLKAQELAEEERVFFHNVNSPADL